MKSKLSEKLNKEMIIIILSLAWPTMVEQMMQTAVQYVDTAMVGSLGTQATAAVGATSTINWLISGTISALGIGFLAFIAQANGANDKEAASKAVAQAVLVTLVVGIGATILTSALSGVVPVWMQVDEGIQDMAARYFFILYLPMLPRTATIIFGTVLRAAGDTKTPMKVGISVNLINVVLNYLLIYETRRITVFGLTFTMIGAGWGVEGAAIASAISMVFGGIRITMVMYKHPMVSPKGRSIKPDNSILSPCLKVAIPNMMQRFATSLGYVAFAAMVNSLGEVATAAHTIANTVESAFYIPGYGMQTAASTLAGNAYGAGDNKRMKDMVSMFIPIVIVLMVLSGGALFFLAEPLVGIFSKSEEVIRLGTSVLQMVALSEPFFGYAIIMEGVLLGVGNTKQPFLYNVLGMWGVRILGTFICTQILGFGLISTWACMILHNLLLFAMYLKNHLSGKWNPLENNMRSAFDK